MGTYSSILFIFPFTFLLLLFLLYILFTWWYYEIFVVFSINFIVSITNNFMYFHFPFTHFFPIKKYPYLDFIFVIFFNFILHKQIRVSSIALCVNIIIGKCKCVYELSIYYTSDGSGKIKKK